MYAIPDTSYTHRFLARIILQAETPLAIGSGENNTITDSLVIRDVNGLPYIPATGLAGVLRHTVDKHVGDLLFGHPDKENPLNNKGSQLIFSEARIVGAKGEVLDGLQNIDQLCTTDDERRFYKAFRTLPIRQHVRIGDKGVTENTGKFDEEVVYKGTHFCFEIELVGNLEQINLLKKDVLPRLASLSFRLGSKTRSGLGEVKIVECKSQELDLSKKDDLASYLSKSSSLNNEKFWSDASKLNLSFDDKQWITYKLTLKPDDFFLFGSGFGDNDAAMTPVREDVVVYPNGNGRIEPNYILFPGSSIKGALAHRVAFYYNKQKGNFSDNLSCDERKRFVGRNNLAVKQLFGSEGNLKRRHDDKDNGMIGNVIFSDLLRSSASFSEMLLTHVAIDRFTGGAMGGALFTEKMLFGKGYSFECSVRVKKTNLDEDVKAALESAIGDLCAGMLPLGGGVNRGNGCFTGEFEKI